MQRITTATIFIFSATSVVVGLFVGSILSSVTSKIGRYYKPVNTEFALTSNVGDIYVGSKGYDRPVNTTPGAYWSSHI